MHQGGRRSAGPRSAFVERRAEGDPGRALGGDRRQHAAAPAGDERHCPAILSHRALPKHPTGIVAGQPVTTDRSRRKAAAPFWQDRCRPGPKSAPLALPRSPLMQAPCRSTGVGLSRRPRIRRPAVHRRRIRALKPRCRHPALDGPRRLSWRPGNRAVASRLPAGSTPLQIARSWSDRIPLEPRPGHRRLDAEQGNPGRRAEGAPGEGEVSTSVDLGVAGRARTRAICRAVRRQRSRPSDAEILTDADLKELGLPFGPRKRLLAALRQDHPAEPVMAVVTPEGERRQLTVLFCDLVGSTELALQVDPELLETIIQKYEDACEACIGRYDGYVYRLLGDGILAFFGFPLAHEGEAARAIRAALEIVETISHLEVPAVGRLKVRIGIATGIVVVAPGKRNVIGETMNLAARLQGVAEAGRHRGERSRLPAGRRGIRLRDFGRARSEGHCGADARVPRGGSERGRQPVRRCRPGEGVAARRTSARDGGSARALAIGLRPAVPARPCCCRGSRAWARVASPARFSSAWRQKACARCGFNARRSTSIAPFIRSLPISSGSSTSAATRRRDSRLDKLEALVVRHYGLPLGDVRLLAAMLSVPHEQRYGPLGMTPRLVKEETIRVLVDIVKAAARRAAVPVAVRGCALGGPDNAGDAGPPH